MAALGVRIFTDDGAGVQDNLLMRRAMEYGAGLGVILAQHCEDDALCGGGHMHEAAWSARLFAPRVLLVTPQSEAGLGLAERNKRRVVCGLADVLQKLIRHFRIRCGSFERQMDVLQSCGFRSRL